MKSLPMADTPAEKTPISSIKRSRPFSKKTKTTAEKTKRINSRAITLITPVDLDTTSSSEEERYEMASGGRDDGTDLGGMKNGGTIAVSDLERLLDKRFSVLATSEQIKEMGNRMTSVGIAASF